MEINQSTMKPLNCYSIVFFRNLCAYKIKMEKILFSGKRSLFCIVNDVFLSRMFFFFLLGFLPNFWELMMAQQWNNDRFTYSNERKFEGMGKKWRKTQTRIHKHNLKAWICVFIGYQLPFWHRRVYYHKEEFIASSA